MILVACCFCAFLQYAQHGHSPINNHDQTSELRHIIRRLSHHASIVVYDGCNECTVILGTPTGVYASFVMTVVAQEDKSRSIWPSCPALGWTKGVDQLTSRPLPNTPETMNSTAPVLARQSQNLISRPCLVKIAQNLDLRCVLVPAPWVLGPKHVSNPE